MSVGVGRGLPLPTGYGIVGFNVPLDRLYIILKTIFPAKYLTGAKNWSF